jgi:hypothetical protein
VPPDTPSEECGSRTATAEGVYTKVVPNELLQFTWIPTFSPGEESLVTITFTDARGGTQVDIRHERFATEASREAHNSGWANCLEKLDSMSANLYSPKGRERGAGNGEQQTQGSLIPVLCSLFLFLFLFPDP